MNISSDVIERLPRVEGLLNYLSPMAEKPMNLTYEDRKSTRLNSSHLVISYAVFCLKKKKHLADRAAGARSQHPLLRPPSPCPRATASHLHDAHPHHAPAAAAPRRHHRLLPDASSYH